MKILGIDFDNTLVSYDDLFCEIASERGFTFPESTSTKEEVRDHIRSLGREEEWTLLQGHVYGSCMMRAKLFEGALEALRQIRDFNYKIVLISHRSRFPYAGFQYDLHAAALEFLEEHRLLVPDGPLYEAHFETSKEAKIAKIMQYSCSHFLDDLPEILSMESFPSVTRKILFSSKKTSSNIPKDTTVVSHWGELPSILQND